MRARQTLQALGFKPRATVLAVPRNAWRDWKEAIKLAWTAGRASLITIKFKQPTP